MPRVEKMLELQASVERCYELWSRFEDFPSYMHDVREVRRTGPDLYHWLARAPRGQQYEWDMRVVQRQENRQIGWESISGIGHSGTARFEPADGGCRMQLWIELNLPGAAGEVFAKVGQDVEQQVRATLRNFKQAAEKSQNIVNRTR